MKPIFSYQHNNLVFETYTEKPKVKGFQLLELDQVHSATIVPFKDSGSRADGFKFEESELARYIPAIRTADCLPVWIQSGKTHYLIHAGWRGLEKNIFKTIPFIDFSLIGPSIQPQSFEVQKDFYKNFDDHQFFHKNSEKLTFDLQAYAKKLMTNISADIKQIIDSKVCTYESDQLHSYRLDKTNKRNWSIIRSLR